jgi:hypothetical protein
LVRPHCRQLESLSNELHRYNGANINLNSGMLFFAEIIVWLSSMLRFATEIKEMDINPLMGKGNQIIAVDARIAIEKRENM